MDPRRVLAIVRRRLPLLLASVALSGGLALLASSVLPKTYEATATLIVGQSLSAANPDYDQVLVSQRLSSTYAAVATMRPMLEAVVDRLGLDDPAGELARRVQADAEVNSTLLTITAQDADPGQAAAVANALADELIAASPAIQGRQAEFQAIIDADLADMRSLIDTTQARVDVLVALPARTDEQDAELQALEGRLVTLRATYATLLAFSSGSAANLLSVVEPAVAPIEPVSPRPLLNTLIAAALGLLVAAAVISLAEYLDDTVKDPEVVQALTGLATLGTIARMRGDRGRAEIYRLATLLYPRSGVAEAFRTLRTNLEFASVDAPVRTVLVTSASAGEGKTVTAANLAVAFAQAGKHVLLVDADLRKPGIHLVFDLPNDRGLTSLLRTNGPRIESVTHAPDQENLLVLTSGPLPPNPAELLGSQRMRALMEQLTAGADLVVVDGPPVHAVADPLILSALVDGTLLVIDSARSRPQAVRLAVDTLSRAGAHVLGVVLNQLPAGSRSEYAGYYGGYGSDEGAERVPRAAGGSTAGPGESAHLPGTR